VAVVVSAKPVVKAKAKPVLRAMAPRLLAAMARQADRALKAKAMVAAKEAVMAAEARSNAAIRVLTTGVTAKAVPHHAAHALKAVAQVADLKVGVATPAVKTADVTTATSCHATLTRSRPHNLRVWICPTASPCAPAANPTRPAPASTAWPAAVAAMVAAVAMAVATVAATAAVAAAEASVADQPPAPQKSPLRAGFFCP
jgi:hypothetical protein